MQGSTTFVQNNNSAPAEPDYRQTFRPPTVTQGYSQSNFPSNQPPMFSPMTVSAQPGFAQMPNIIPGSTHTFFSKPTPMYSSANIPSYPTTMHQTNSNNIQPVFYNGVQTVSPTEFNRLFNRPQNIPVTNIAHTQMRTLPMDHVNGVGGGFMPAAVVPKYSTQMTARVKYQGAATKAEFGKVKPAQTPQSISVSVLPMAKPNQIPVAANSYALVQNESRQVEFQVIIFEDI
jgi:hypothetical protein